MIFSVFSGIVGLAVSYYTNVATGPMIVIIASVIYFSTFIFGRKLKNNGKGYKKQIQNSRYTI